MRDPQQLASLTLMPESLHCADNLPVCIERQSCLMTSQTVSITVLILQYKRDYRGTIQCFGT